MARAPILVQQSAAQAFANRQTFWQSHPCSRRVGKAAHEGVACTRGVHYIHFEGGDSGDFFGSGDEAAVGAERDGDYQTAAMRSRAVATFSSSPSPVNFACGGFAGFENVHQAERGAEFFLGAEVGTRRKSWGKQ